MADKNNFLYEYIRNRGMQNMTKTEYEQVLFYYFICKEKLFSKNDVTSLSAKELYSISDELGIDIQKVKALIKKMPYVRDSDRTKGSEKSFYQIIMEHLSTSSDTLAKGYLELSLENPLELERVKRLIAENGGKTDTSFSNSILKIPFESVSQILPVAEQKELTEKICEVLESVKKQLPDRENELSKEVNDTIKTPKLDKVLSVLEQVSRIGVNVTESFANIFFLK